MSHAPDEPLGVLVFFDKDGGTILHNQCSLGIIMKNRLSVYRCNGKLITGISAYSKFVYQPSLVDFHKVCDTCDCFLLPTTDVECRRIYETCEACVKAKLSYSVYEMFMSAMPFRDPSDPGIFQVSGVRNTQAVVLILRECLDPATGTLLSLLANVNSRTIMPSDLYALMRPVACVFTLSLWNKCYPPAKA